MAETLTKFFFQFLGIGFVYFLGVMIVFRKRLAMDILFAFFAGLAGEEAGRRTVLSTFPEPSAKPVLFLLLALASYSAFLILQFLKGDVGETENRSKRLLRIMFLVCSWFFVIRCGQGVF